MSSTPASHQTARPLPGRAPRRRTNKWPGLLAAAWGVVFAAPSFVWATGSTFGAQSTVSQSLVTLAQDRVPWFVAVLWATGFVKLFGALVGISLTRLRGGRTGRLTVLCGGAAATLLVWHGGLFVVHGLLVEAGTVSVARDLAALTGWYLYLWGPWFIAGGLAFATATALYVRRHDDRHGVRLYGAAGAIGALLLSLLSTVTGIG